MTFDFPQDIRNTIERACRDAKPSHYGPNFIHTDDGTPTASLGRLSGGLHQLEVYDDLIVGPDDAGQWGIWSDRGEPLGSYVDAKALRAGLREAIDALYPRRPWRRSMVVPVEFKKGHRSPVTA